MPPFLISDANRRAGLRQAGEVQHWPLLRPLGERFAVEAAACVLFPAADDIAAQQVGQRTEVGVMLQGFLCRGDAQRLLQGGFDLVEQGVDASPAGARSH